MKGSIVLPEPILTLPCRVVSESLWMKQYVCRVLYSTRRRNVVRRLKAAERRPPGNLCTRRVMDPAIWDIPPGPDCALLWDTSADKSRSCGSSLADVLSRIGLG